MRAHAGGSDGATGPRASRPGLFYPTNAAADEEEVSAVAARFAEMGGVYATHMRNEFDRVLDSIDESVRHGRRGARAAHRVAPQMRRPFQLGAHARNAAAP